MTPQETTLLLSYCAGLDPWLKSFAPDEAAMTLAGWSDLLGAVPLEFAKATAKRHYSHPDARTLTPGEVLSLWNAERRRAQTLAERDERAATALELNAGTAEVQTVIPAGGATEYLEALAEAIAAGKDPRSVPRPAGVRVLSPVGDVASRRCRHHDICACTHTECRDGWLDVETTVVNGNGASYPAVERCPNCEDAGKMADELGRTKTAGRRR